MKLYLRLKIGIDARIMKYRHGGISQYIYWLVNYLSQIDKTDNFEIFLPRNYRWTARVGQNFHFPTLLTPPHNRWEQVFLPLELSRHGVNIFHSPDFIPPFRLRKPEVITVHDLAFLHFDTLLTRESRGYYNQVKAAANRADAIIAVSWNTKKDLIELLSADPQKISVIYHGVDPSFCPYSKETIKVDLSNVFSYRDIKNYSVDYFLFVGTIEPRKNLPFLFQSFKLAKAELGAKGAFLKLVIAGARGWLSEESFSTVKDLQLEDSVIFLGEVRREELVVLYNGAKALLMPSKYEGFGMPLVEAMACGTPVIAANNSAIPEILNDSGIKLGLDDPDGWAQAMLSLLEDEEKARILSEAGLTRAQDFSWVKTAAETLTVYRNYADGKYES